MLTQPGIRGVQRRRLYEDIVLQFHSLIRRGVLQHGTRLPSERLLAEQLKVSRSSVREAIRSLELQGLVVSRRGSGTFINTDNLDSVVALIATTLSSGGETLRDIFEVRHLMEPQIAAVAAQRADQEEVRHLGNILEEQRKQISEGETGVDADTAFHFALASATHNRALLKVVSAVEDILRLSRDQYLQEPGRPRRSLASHRRILEMLRAGDAEGARQAMEQHLTSVEPSYQPSAVSRQQIPPTPFTKGGIKRGF
jgi:GntR family transcriptional repressor for pyruvate dehydrogenase complex